MKPLSFDSTTSREMIGDERARAIDRLPRDEYVEVCEPAPKKEPRRKESRYVDLESVPPSQWKIHDRLLNWARWCHGSNGEPDRIHSSPMFDLYRSTEAKRAYGEETGVPVDKDDALKIHFGIVHPTFAPKERRALQWCYLRPRAPSAAARELGVSLEGLRDLIRSGRQLLLDRGV